MCGKPPVEACHFSVAHIVWCSEGPCEPSNGNQFTDLDPDPLEIEHRGTDFTFILKFHQFWPTGYRVGYEWVNMVG